MEKQVDLLIEEFKVKTELGRKPSIAEYIAQIPQSAARDEFLEELIQIELEYFLSNKRQPNPSRYLDLGDKAFQFAKIYLAEVDSFAIPSIKLAHKLPRASLPFQSYSRGDHIHNYQLLEIIGQGGFGTVWEAEQLEPVRRRVAIKLISQVFADETSELIARFEAERQALAMMSHRNIAKILDGGTTEKGHPFFVMELVKGSAINTYCDQLKLTIDDRLEIFVQVCDAIQHAHQKGIIHRDLKPTNILIESCNDVPIAKVIDFGLAKALDHTRKLTSKIIHTELGRVVGTLQYMSPEQAAFQTHLVDTRTDVFSLGVILYELLIGSTPIPKETVLNNEFFTVVERIRSETPARPSDRLSSFGETVSEIAVARNIKPSRLNKLLRGELDWIVMKSLEKEPQRRYATAEAFANDIKRFLNGEPVLAKPPSITYLVAKNLNRNKALAISLFATFVILVAGALSTTVMWYQARIETEQTIKMLDLIVMTLGDYSDEKQPKNFTAEEILNASFSNLEQLEIRDELKADIYRSIQKAYFELGNEKAGINAVQRELAIRNMYSGAKHPKTLEAKHDLAMFLRRLKKYPESINLHQEVLEIRQNVLGEFHSDTLKSMNNLATAKGYQATSSDLLPPEDVITSLETVLKLRIEYDGDDSKSTATTCNNLGFFLSKFEDDKIRLKRSIKLLEKAKSIREKEYGAGHDKTLITTTNLAYANLRLGNTREGLTSLVEVLNRRKELLDPDHKRIRNSFGHLVEWTHKIGDYEGAINYGRQGLQWIKKNGIVDLPTESFYRVRILNSLLHLRYYKEIIPEFKAFINDANDDLSSDEPSFGENFEYEWLRIFKTAIKIIIEEYDEVDREFPIEAKKILDELYKLEVKDNGC